MFFKFGMKNFIKKQVNLYWKNMYFTLKNFKINSKKSKPKNFYKDMKNQKLV